MAKRPEIRRGQDDDEGQNLELQYANAAD